MSRASAALTSDEKEFAREKSMIRASQRSSRVDLTARPQKKRLELSLGAGLLNSISESDLLLELREFYETNDEIRFQSRYQALQERFPASSQLSEAHYMAGLMALTNKNYGRALKSFDRAMRDPKKASQAMFAKAITYRRLNLNESSFVLLKKVQAMYPKSLEAQRAQVEMKIMEKRIR